ncbi:hypothetical protein CASFOL_013521 [Castilleja foliolosa]|uniref:Uncharacterized protein n=1 Tax=Castilleja foliolosa TaxID=1961234 RepID=A0ABD3DM01_9LAMI
MDFGMYINNNNTYINGHLQLMGSKKRSSTEFAVAAANGDDVIEAERASSRASDDDEMPSTPEKKLRLSKQQSAFLEESFEEHHTLNPKNSHLQDILISDLDKLNFGFGTDEPDLASTTPFSTHFPPSHHSRTRKISINNRLNSGIERRRCFPGGGGDVEDGGGG